MPATPFSSLTIRVDWLPLRQTMHSSSPLIILTHVRPDGDAIGSCLGLALLAKSLGKSVRIELDGSCPINLSFLQPSDLMIPFGTLPIPDNAEIVVVDTGTWNQLKPFQEAIRSPGRKVVVVDHHKTQDDLGGHLILDTNAEAASVLIAQFYKEMGEIPDPLAATALFVGLANDTGWFRHSNCHAGTFQLAGELVKHGANPAWIHDQLFCRESIQRQRIKGHVFSTMKLHADGRIGSFKFRKTEPNILGGASIDSVGGLVDIPRQVANVKVALGLYEQNDGSTRASLRSDGSVDVASICAKYGGGGHKPAAGCTINLDADQAELMLINEISKALDCDKGIDS